MPNMFYSFGNFDRNMSDMVIYYKTLPSTVGGCPLFLYEHKRFTKGGLLQMITISLQTVYYAIGIASILCTSAYKLGYEIGKNARK